MTLEAALAAPVEVKCGDRAYKFSKLNLEDWAAFCEHIKAERRAEIRECPAEDRPKLYRELIREAIDPEDMFRSAMTLPGMRWLLHRAVSRNHEEVEIEDVGGLVGGLSRMTELIELIADLPESEEESSDPPAK